MSEMSYVRDIRFDQLRDLNCFFFHKATNTLEVPGFRQEYIFYSV